MDKIKLIDGKELPCFQTMGALVRYSRLAGKDLGDSMGMADVALWLYCLTSEACRATEVPFPYEDFETFACRVDMADFSLWAASLGDATPAAGKKKASR